MPRPNLQRGRLQNFTGELALAARTVSATYRIGKSQKKWGRRMLKDSNAVMCRPHPSWHPSTRTKAVIRIRQNLNLAL